MYSNDYSLEDTNEEEDDDIMSTLITNAKLLHQNNIIDFHSEQLLTETLSSRINE